MSPISSCLVLSLLGLPGGGEWIIIGLIGLLLFGKRLPEVGKSLGRSIVEFKRGLKGVEDDIDRAVEADQSDMLPPPDNSKSSEGQTRTKESAAPSNSSSSSD